jgi:tRNA C32,U32 (ribose-2'-O)-methylase TrmJ
MVATKASNLDPSTQEQPVDSASDQLTTDEVITAEDITPDQVDDIFKELKNLLSTVEKLQKARQDVGDIKPMLLRLLDGELLAEEELDQLKSGVSGLSKLVKLYTDYQIALEKAQPARVLLDQVIKS